MSIMRYIRGSLVVLALTVGAIQCAHSADKTPTVDNTSTLLVLQLEERTEGYVFVSKTGQAAPISEAACEKSKRCETLVLALIKTGHFAVLHIPASACPETSTPGVSL